MANIVTDPVEEILQLHQKVSGRVQEAVGQAFQKSLPEAIRLGELLTEQKEAMPHGEFGPWLEENVPLSQKSVSNYMRVYAQRDNPKLVMVTNWREAYKLFGPKRKRTPKPKPEPEVIDTEGETVPEPPVMDTEGETLPPEDPGPLLDTEPEVAPEVIDTSDPVFSDDDEDEPESERLSIRDIVARSGKKPMNWTSPEGVDPREKFKAMGVSPIASMTQQEAEAARPGYEWPQKPDPGFEAALQEDEPRVTLQDERDALPDEAVELATEIIKLSNEETLVKFLKTLLEKRLRK